MISEVKTMPWGTPSAPVPPCSLEDVMSEQLAKELQNKEENNEEQFKTDIAAAPSSLTDDINTVAEKELTDEELAKKLASEELEQNQKCDPNDETIALMLQKQFDKEFDQHLSKKEKKYNGNSKVYISFDNFKRKLVQEQYENANEVDDDDDDFYEEDGPEYPTPSQWEKGAPVIGNRGYSGQGRNIVTKHDKVICGRRNAERLMEFPPDFGSGDGEGMDMQLPNKVYNKLKRHSQAEDKRGYKVHEKKDHSSAIKAVDEKTRILIFKMINSGFLSSVDGVISEGKEAVVFKATGGHKDDVALPKDVILKVYKTSMNEFKTRMKYINGDYRLSKDVLKKYNARKIMRKWAEKEFLNLKKMKRNGIPCPRALALKKHILAMECVGGEIPAPKLRDVVCSPAELQDAYEQTVELMKNIYHRCNMVHADFSPYNLLWHESKIWVIDVGQAVDRDNQSSGTFLLRDCKNVCDYFRLKGVHEVPTAEDLFNEITNYSIQGEGKVFESQVTRYEKEEYAFDYFFEISESTRLQKLDIDDSSSDSDNDRDDVNDNDDDDDDDEKVVDDKINDKDKDTSCGSTNTGEVTDRINDCDTSDSSSPQTSGGVVVVD